MKHFIGTLGFALILLLFIPAILIANGDMEEEDDAVKVALILDQRRGDQGLIDRTVEGVTMVAEEHDDVEIQIIETRDASEYEDTFRSMTKEWGADLIITVFEGLVKPAMESAKENPDVKYLLIFGFVEEAPPNVLPLKYKDAEAYYISGVMAGMRTQTGKIAFTAGLDLPNAQEAYAAYVKGAKSIRSDVETNYSVVGSFEDPAKGKEVAESLISQGYDVICGWASKSDWGVAEAAQNAGNAWITGLSGVIDLRPKYGSAVIGQVGVDFGLSAYQITLDIKNGKWRGGKAEMRTIASGDIGLHWIPTEADGYTQEQIDYILQVEDDIRTGKISVD